MKKIILLMALCLTLTMIATTALAASGDISDFKHAIYQIDIYNDTTGQWVTILQNDAPVPTDICTVNVFSNQQINIPTGHYSYMKLIEAPTFTYKGYAQATDGTYWYTNGATIASTSDENVAKAATTYTMTKAVSSNRPDAYVENGRYYKYSNVNFSINENVSHIKIKIGATLVANFNDLYPSMPSFSVTAN